MGQPLDIERSSSSIGGQAPCNSRERTPIAPPLPALEEAHSQVDETQTPESETHFDQEPGALKLEPLLTAKAQVMAAEQVERLVFRKAHIQYG